MDKLLPYFAKYPLDFMAHLSCVLPIITGLIRYNQLTISSRLIWLFFIWFFLKETYTLVLALSATNNLYVQNIEPIFETVFCGLIYYYCLLKLSERSVASIGALICTAVLIYSYESEAVSAVSLSTFRIFAIILVLIYFNRLLTDMHVISITRHTLFWFSSGLLLYSAGTFFIVLFSEYWYQGINKVPAEIFDRYWNSNQLLFIAFSTLSAIGLWLSKYDRYTV